MIEIADNILIGGGLSYTFFKAQGYEIGQSLVDNSKLDLALEFHRESEEAGQEFPDSGRYR